MSLLGDCLSHEEKNEITGCITGLLILFVLGNQAFATENAIDVVPAATLLLPYFEVDLANPNGVTTLFSVNNASAAPQLAHITFWTDQSRPTLDFTIYLTGYDVWTVNLGPLFRTGMIPLFIQPPAHRRSEAGARRTTMRTRVTSRWTTARRSPLVRVATARSRCRTLPGELPHLHSARPHRSLRASWLLEAGRAVRPSTVRQQSPTPSLVAT